MGEMLTKYFVTAEPISPYHYAPEKGAEVNAAIKAYRVYAKKVPLDNGDYTMDHTAVVYLMDKDGHFVAPFNLKQSADEAAAQIRRYL